MKRLTRVGWSCASLCYRSRYRRLSCSCGGCCSCGVDVTTVVVPVLCIVVPDLSKASAFASLIFDGGSDEESGSRYLGGGGSTFSSSL
jgi:hypothetical protein